MKLIEDWKASHRLYSQRLNAAGVVISSAYVMFYDQLRDMLPARHLAVLTVAFFAVNCVARIIKQEPKHGPRS